MKENRNNGKKFNKWLPLISIIFIMLALFFLGFYNVDYFGVIVENKDRLKTFAAEKYIESILVFSALYISSVALSIPIATVLTLLGGYIYGLLIGTIIVTISATIGASIIFIIAKSSMGTSLKDKANKLYVTVQNEFNKNAIHYLLFLRLVPLFPFFLVNIVPAFFNIPIRVFALTTFIGIIPGTFVYVNFGYNLGKISDFNDIFSLEMIFSFILLGCFVLLPVIYKHMKAVHDTNK